MQNIFSVFFWNNRLDHAQWNAINGCYIAVKRDWEWNERLIIPFEANNNFQFVLVWFLKITICFVEKKNPRTSNKLTKIGREMKERQMNMTFLEINSDVVQRGPTAKRFRSGMFGVSSLPIYRSRKRDKLDEFDGIRSILSHRYIILAHGYISCLLFLSCPYCVICRSLPRCVCLRVDK